MIIWSLPFPPNDPVFAAKRKASTDPYSEIDLPHMILRLRQGMGRLIRTHEDQGVVTILDARVCKDDRLRTLVEGVLPEGVELVKQ